MGSNNGQKGFINEDPKFLNEGNTISFGQDTATMFYQEKPYFTGDKIKILKSKEKRFGKKNAQFFIAAMMKSFSSFSWGSSSYSVDVIENQKVTFPVLSNKKIDFDFIESLLAEIEVECIAKLDQYLIKNGLSDYDLTKEENEAIKYYSKLKFNDFNVIDVFNVKNAGNILSRDIIQNSGDTPYLCASSENNGVSSYISYDEKYLDKGDCIFIGGKTFVVSYQAKDYFSNDSHNLALYLKEKERRSKLNQLFLTCCIDKSLSHIYSWGYSISNRKIQKDKVSLPVKDGKPDYGTMETVISAIHKMVIKDLVLYVKQKKEELNKRT